MSATGLNKLPFGNLPRLLMAWICNEAVKTGSRELVLARIMQCAVKRRRFSVGAKPTRQLSLQPVAIGAVEEVTNLLKPSVQRVALGDLAKVQAVTSSER